MPPQHGEKLHQEILLSTTYAVVSFVPIALDHIVSLYLSMADPGPQPAQQPLKKGK